MMQGIRTLLMACLTALASSAVAQGGAPVRLVIAFPPGVPVDFVARVLADGLRKELGQTVIVDNRAGANGGISAQLVAKSAPDGMTLWFSRAGAVVMNPALYQNLTYDVARDVTPVSLVVNNVEVLVVNAADPAGSAADLVAISRQQQDPVPIASSGIGSMPLLAMELLADSSGA